jgi:hypothetical protein
MKLLYAPIAIVSGRLARVTSRRLTNRLWGLVGHGRRPRPDERAAPWPRLVGALLIEGAVFRLVGGLVDHVSRRGFAAVTGSWPGRDGADGH